MNCSHPDCTGNHRTGGSKEGLCPAALARRRENQLTRYHDRYKQKARDTRRRYYLANREHLLARANSYWREHRAQMIAAATERKRAERLAGIIYRSRTATIEKEPDREWWKPKPSEIPRRWILEAA